jgi:hypothetical protein
MLRPKRNNIRESPSSPALVEANQRIFWPLSFALSEERSTVSDAVVIANRRGYLEM